MGPPIDAPGAGPIIRPATGIGVTLGSGRTGGLTPAVRGPFHVGTPVAMVAMVCGGAVGSVGGTTIVRLPSTSWGSGSRNVSVMVPAFGAEDAVVGLWAELAVRT